MKWYRFTFENSDEMVDRFFPSISLTEAVKSFLHLNKLDTQVNAWGVNGYTLTDVTEINSGPYAWDAETGMPLSGPVKVAKS